MIRIAGDLRQGVHTLDVRVYYEDTDFSGVVYHASYLRFMERGRSDLLRHCDIHHKELEARDPALGFAVASMSLDFKSPARIDDVITVKTSLSSIKGASMTLSQSILRDDCLLVSAQVKVACILLAGGPARIPTDIVSALQTSLTAG